jgi:HAMP domain-containing protein
MADDARKLYIEDREAEDKANEPNDAEIDAQIDAEIDAAIAAEMEQADAAAAEAPTDSNATEGAAPAGPDPNLIPPTPLAPDTPGIGTARDLRNSAVRGPIKGLANAVDFGARTLDGTLEYLGVPPETFSSGTRAGDLVDNLMGTPETTGGQVVQDVTGLLAPMRMITGPLEYASRAQRFGATLLGSALLETSLTSDKNPGLSNIGASMPEDHWSHNWLTEMLALEKDDSGFQKFTKRTVENLILNKVAEKTANVIGNGWMKLRGLKKDIGAVTDSAAEAGEQVAPKLEEAVKKAAIAQHEADVVTATVEDATPAAAQAKTLTGEHAELAASHEAARNTLEDVSTSITAAETSLKAATKPADKKALKAHLKELTDQRQVLMDEVKSIEGRLDPKFVERVGELEALDGAVEALTTEASSLTKQLNEATGLGKGPIAARLKKIQGQLSAAEADRAALKGAQQAPVKAAPAAPAAPAGPAAGATGGEDVLREKLRALREEYGKLQPQGGGVSTDPAAVALRTQIDETINQIRSGQTTPAAATPGAPGAAQAAPEAPVVPVELQAGLQKKAKFTTDEAFDQTEGIVKGMEELGDGFSPEYLNGIKESAVEGGIKFSPEQVARMDAAIAAKTKIAPDVKDEFFGSHLAMTKDQMTALKTAFMAGDFKGATETLGKAIGDTTNFSKIAASGDVTDLLAEMMKWFGKDENSYRLLAQRSQKVTYANAQEEIEALANKFGTDANQMRLALEAQFPGKDLTKVLTAYRILEASVAKQSHELAKAVRFGGDQAIAAEKELTKMLSLTGIINDRRAGLVSDIARALNSMQIAVEPATRVLRAAALEARNMGYEAFIQSHGGGRKNIQRLAEMIVAAENGEDIVNLVGKAATLTSGTLGDALYAYVIHNSLTGPLSALKNLSSSAFYQGVWKPFDNMFGAITRDMYSAGTGGDVYAIRKELRRVRATYAAARKSLATDSIVRRNMRQAWQTGQRVTAGSGAFAENVPGGVVTRLGEGNMARATELARTLRDGGNIKLPMGPRVPLGAAVFGQKRLNKMASALDASADTRRLWSPLQADPGAEIAKRYGLAAKVVDYSGRVNSWPMHALATGDEWNASIAKSAALEAEAFEAVTVKLKLKGDEADQYARDLIDNVHMLEDLWKKADAGTLTPSQMRRLEIMQEVSDKADDYVREVTFTHDPNALTKAAAHVRSEVPGARWMMFFVRTPGNIAEAGAQNFPGGRLVQAGYALGRGDKAAAAEMAGRAATGTALALTTYELVTNGTMTGSGPSDPEANALWQSEGNKPYMMRVPTGVGPVEINYGSFIDPVGIPMQVMAELVESHQYMDDQTFGAFVEEFRGRFHRLLESKSYLGQVTDLVDLLSGRADLTKTMVRVGKNFVPQSRLLASLRTNGLPVPPGVGKAVIGAEGPDDQFMSLQEFIDGDKYKGIIDRGTGVMANAEGKAVDIHGGIIDSPFVVSLVSNVAEDLPEFIAEPWLELNARILGVRAQHGKFVQRDQLGEKRVLPVGYGPSTPSGLLGGKKDPVRDELIAVGMDKSVQQTFGQFMGQELTPEQQDFYQRRYRRPTKDDDTAEEMFAKAIASKEYQALGDTVGDVKGGKYKILNPRHESRLAVAQAMLMDRFPELRDVFLTAMQQPAQMMSKEGSDAFAAERAARAPALLKAFEESLNGID